jgi:hypothetical protein
MKKIVEMVDSKTEVMLLPITVTITLSSNCSIKCKVFLAKEDFSDKTLMRIGSAAAKAVSAKEK